MLNVRSAAKNILSSKSIIQDRRRDKDIPRQTKIKVHDHKSTLKEISQGIFKYKGENKSHQAKKGTEKISRNNNKKVTK